MTDVSTSRPVPQDLLVVLRHPPHGTHWLREGLDVALVAAAFGQRVGLLFQGDGIYALLKGQQAGALGQKGTHPQLAMLEMYDIETLWVSARGLNERGLSADDLMLPVVPLEASAVTELLQRHPHTLIF
ncbi:MAG: sulfurtransferase complex subunit TusC [Salinicola sp.]|uniref:sulfurtransferase complex subunit TusC n=1 Tax=Salinicola sp. TaxID=1978524 RepID=UPI001D7A4D50|nr:sulfurtransferase complex subunit TusC [Salinicola sp.]NRB56082.1 sulfurtransferase complex subunit TusC [Salinicola sp.]